MNKTLNKICPKCGNNYLAVRYCTGSGCRFPIEQIQSEHLHRKCPECGHEFYEECFDDTEEVAA